METKIVAKNRKASLEFFLLERLEAGLVLQGSEIKSIRGGQVSLAEAYVRIDDAEAWLIDAHIAPYVHSSYDNHDPKRPRKLLLNQSEIRHLWNEVRLKGMTIIPTIMYLKSGRAKIEIAIAKGKKLHDKRTDIAKRDAMREIERQYSKRK